MNGGDDKKDYQAGGTRPVFLAGAAVEGVASTLSAIAVRFAAPPTRLYVLQGLCLVAHDVLLRVGGDVPTRRIRLGVASHTHAWVCLVLVHPDMVYLELGGERGAELRVEAAATLHCLAVKLAASQGGGWEPP